MSSRDKFFVFIWILTLAKSSLGQDPDWSCDFENGGCNIAQETGDDGYWKISQFLFNKYYYADFYTSNSDYVDCTLPFQAYSGTFSFRQFSRNGFIQVTFCEGGNHTKVGPNWGWTDFTISFSCASNSKILIRAVNSKDGGNPNVGVDDIKVFADRLSSTDFPSTSWKPTSAVIQSTSEIAVSTPGSTSLSPTSSSPSSKYHTTIVASETTSMTSQNHIRTTGSEKPRTFKTTDSFPRTTQNSTLPNEDPEGVPVAFIASVSVIFPVLLLVTAIVFIGYRRRRVPQQMDSDGDHGKVVGDNIYTNQAFSAKDVSIEEPDVIRDAHLNNGLTTQHSSSSNHQGSSHRLWENGNSGFKEDNPSVQGDYTDLRTPELKGHQEEDADQEYFVLERPCDMDNGGIKETAYDRVDRDIVHDTDQEELHDNNYGAVAVMSDDTHYNALVHGNEAFLNRDRDGTNRKSTDPGRRQDAGDEYGRLNFADEKEPTPLANMDDNHYNSLVHGNEAVNQRCNRATNQTNTVSKTKQDGGNEYGRLNLAEEKESTPLANMDDNHYNSLMHGNEAVDQRCNKEDAENEYGRLNFGNEKESTAVKNMDDSHYNVLGETDVDRIGNRASTGKDTTHSEDELYSNADQLGDYHLYQDPAVDRKRGPTTNDTSKRWVGDDVYYYSAGDIQGQGMTEGSNHTPLSQEEVPDDEYYSYVNVQGQVDNSEDKGDIQHEPIYSSDVYSELDL